MSNSNKLIHLVTLRQNTCTCKLLAENSVDNVDYYIIKVVLELSS